LLEELLGSTGNFGEFPALLVGHQTKDDAAALDIGDGRALISTTDFFMPIVDDPVDFGRIAAANALSDVYAMGGDPCLAISILGWPTKKLPVQVASEVLRGAREVCREVNVPLAGGHSIDCPEPVFGLAVSGLVDKRHLKTNAGAQPGDLLFLTKPLGIGILTTAEKRGILREEDQGKARDIMVQVNRCGSRLGKVSGVHAITDVTGFGFLGHALEMAEASGVQFRIRQADVPCLDNLDHYLAQECWPGGTERNWESYGDRVHGLTEETCRVLADPQTSGGLLLAVLPEAVESVLEVEGLSSLKAIGHVEEGTGLMVV